MDILNAILAAKLAGDGGGGGGGSSDGGKKYTDEKVAAALTSAKQYADEKDTSTLSSAKSYADEKDTSTLSSAKSYANTKASETLISAKSFTTSEVNAAKSYADTEIAKAKAEAIAQSTAYADDADEALKTQMEQYVDAAAMNSYVTTEGTIGSATLGAEWTTTEPYNVAAVATGYTVTANTMVTMLPHAGVMNQMRDDGVQTIYISNDNGTLTAYAVGGTPSIALTVPVLFTEVA